MNHNDRIHIKYYSKNELINRQVIRSLIDQSSITGGDLVYDIGAGSGNITHALSEKGARVIGIEKDKATCRKCRQRFLNRENVSIHRADFLQWELPADCKYKVFANIPFIRTAAIVNRLVFNKSPPEDCYLIIQKEAAEKYAGISIDTLASLLIKPVFWVDIIYHFERDDFYPVPSVDIVLIQFERRKCRLVPEKDYNLYRDFVTFCREGRSGRIMKTLKNVFTGPRLKQISAVLQIDSRTSPNELNFVQYLCLFQYYLGKDFKNIALIQGAETRLRQKRVRMPVIHRTNKKRES